MKDLSITTIGKRVLSFVIDSIIVLVASVILFFPFNVIVSNGTMYKNALLSYQVEYDKTCLYIERNDTRIKYNMDEENSYEYDTYSKILYSYYIDYLSLEKDSEYKNYWFNVHVLHLEDTLNRYTDSENVRNIYFEYDSDVLSPGKVKGSTTNVFSNDLSMNLVVKNSVRNFFINEYDEATKDFENNRLLSSESYRILVLNILLAPILSFITSLIILNIIFPTIDKDHRTIGKIICKQAVVHSDGYRLSKFRALFRQFFLVFVEIILGILSFGGMTLISYTMMIIGKNKQSLHDKIVSSNVINSNDSYWYETKEDYEKAIKEQEDGEEII